MPRYLMKIILEVPVTGRLTTFCSRLSYLTKRGKAVQFSHHGSHFNGRTLTPTLFYRTDTRRCLLYAPGRRQSRTRWLQTDRTMVQLGEQCERHAYIWTRRR